MCIGMTKDMAEMMEKTGKKGKKAPESAMHERKERPEDEVRESPAFRSLMANLKKRGGARART